jgi:gliding motility associated protien GldN
MKYLILSLGLSMAFSNHAQFIRGPIPTPAAGVMDGVYISEHIPTKRVVAYEPVREADVVWSKRVWSVIDLRQKFNQPLYYPLDDIQESMWNKNPQTWSMWTIIRQHILNGDLTLYSPFNPNWEDWKDGDGFKYPIQSSLPGGNYYNDSLFREELFIYLGSTYQDPFTPPLKSQIDPAEDSTIYDPILDIRKVVYPDPDTTWFTSSDIVQYKIKEDWFFDKERSKTERRVIGIAPIVYERDVNGNITGLRELFWLYFPECRYVFQNYFLANRHNDAQRMSLDDLFWKRMFQSYIVKESNIYGREIDSYKSGQDALLESEKIENRLNNIEADLWEY